MLRLVLISYMQNVHIKLDKSYMVQTKSYKPKKKLTLVSNVLNDISKEISVIQLEKVSIYKVTVLSHVIPASICLVIDEQTAIRNGSIGAIAD